MHHSFLRSLSLLWLLTTCLVGAPGEERWWMEEPLRMIQTNLPIHQVPRQDPQHLVEELHEMGANTWLFNVGGIYANYPTELEFHASNPYLEEDFVGPALEAARKRGIRVIARFDFSRYTEAIAEKHPDWHFVKEDHGRIVYNGLVTSCINRGYYRSASHEIVRKALQRFDFDGIFVNWWGNQATNWYSQIPNGTCRCPECLLKWEEFSDGPYPEDPWSEEFVAFNTRNSREVAASLRQAIKEIRPEIAFILYHGSDTFPHLDGFTTESRTNYQPNLWWPYESSHFVNLYRSSLPEKMTFNTVVNFVNFAARFIPHRTGVNETRMLQSMAHGAFPALYLIGALDQFDPTGPASARFPFSFHRRNEDLYVRQSSLAEIVLLHNPVDVEANRGLIQLLSELHLPYQIIDFELLGGLPEHSRLVITSSGTTPALESELKQMGAALLAFGLDSPGPLATKSLRTLPEESLLGSYWAIDRPESFPSLDGFELLLNLSPVRQMQANDSLITLVPPARYGPPELVFTDRETSKIPGVLVESVDSVPIVYVPWELPQNYYRHGNAGLRLFFTDLVRSVCRQDPQILTDAHPLVEMSLMKAADSPAVQLHLLNLTAQLQGAHSRSLHFDSFKVGVRGRFQKATSRALGRTLSVEQKDSYSHVRVPRLQKYDVLIFE